MSMKERVKQIKINNKMKDKKVLTSNMIQQDGMYIPAKYK